jgi:hypothetical protein
MNIQSSEIFLTSVLRSLPSGFCVVNYRYAYLSHLRDRWRVSTGEMAHAIDR